MAKVHEAAGQGVRSIPAMQPLHHDFGL